ncbi:uncharacterized protein LOC125770583 [Anopheles funestus]|uniref:uncharacterized protein LOC125770583 n=1 Tax=Anopheles funestus TaxID=62324 RepID=UPI0020C6ADDA|nr:uncharacterized protein LOC125770583 [Anopheles funestus]
MFSFDNSFWSIFTLTLVGICCGSPVLKSGPGIEILPAAFSDGNGPNYVVVNDASKQPSPAPVVGVRSQAPVFIPNQRSSVYQPAPAQVQYQQPQPQPVQYQELEQSEEIQYEEQENQYQQNQYQEPPAQQIQYQQPQQFQYQQPTYQPQSTRYYSPQRVQYAQPEYTYSPYIRAASRRPDAQYSSPGKYVRMVCFILLHRLKCFVTRFPRYIPVPKHKTCLVHYDRSNPTQQFSRSIWHWTQLYLCKYL